MTANAIDDFVPRDIQELYEVHNYRNAAEVLSTGCAPEFQELLEGLRAFRLTISDIRKAGGNESDIPKRISGLLRAKGWHETRIKGDLLITKVSGAGVYRGKTRSKGKAEEDEADTLEKIEELKKKGYTVEHVTRENFLDGHKVDYVKKRVAFDLEWNSKDQTFDRDLYAFRAFHECNLIDAAVLLTRSASLNAVFKKLGQEFDADGKPRTLKSGKPKLIKTKYGASTTWMGKLLSRLDAGRHGSCPLLALGITPNLITDWLAYDKQHS
jgi:CRISPR-associated protein Csd2